MTVPAGSELALYARAAWPSLTQYAHVWGVSPCGQVIGRPTSTSRIDKPAGNANVAPIAEFTVPQTPAGRWQIQFRAVFGVKIRSGPHRAEPGRRRCSSRARRKQLADKHLTQT